MVGSKGVLVVGKKRVAALEVLHIRLDLVDERGISLRLGGRRIPSPMPREYLREGDLAVLRDSGRDFGGYAEVRAVLTPEMRDVWLTLISIEDAVAGVLRAWRIMRRRRGTSGAAINQYDESGEVCVNDVSPANEHASRSAQENQHNDQQ